MVANTGCFYPLTQLNMALRFTKENMFAAAGFVRDSFLSD